MEQLKRILASLSTRQKLAILAVALMAGGSLFWFARWKKEASFKPLFTGLAAEDAAAVTQKLKESGTEYRVAETGGVVLAPADKLAQLRLDMAAAGLPKDGRIGFEIFDKNTLGSTEFVEHVNFQRALEGELERSVASLGEVETARVHITFPKDSVFLDSREPAKASVMVKLRNGAKLSPRNVSAIAHLVASAVEGLAPDGVNVVDMQGNLLSQPKRSAEEQESEETLEYRQKMERELSQKISSTLDPLLGHERYRASVSAELELSSGEQEEETLDPARSVMLTSQKTEEVTTTGLSSGVPGTASNLPRSTRPGGSGNGTQKRTENITYQSSRTVRKTRLPRGALKRLSVAVLLDQGMRWEGAGPNATRVLIPPTPATMQSVKTIVSAAVGFNQERGDLVTVETLPFEATLATPPPPAPQGATPNKQTQPGGAPFDFKTLLKDPKMLIAAAAAVVLLLILGGAAFWMMKRKRGQQAAAPDAAKALPGHSPLAALERGGEEAAAIEEILQQRLAEREAEQARVDEALLASIKVPPVKTQKAEVLVKQLRENTKRDASQAINVLQEWIHDQ